MISAFNTPPSGALRRWILLGAALLIIAVGGIYVKKTNDPDPRHQDQPGARSAFLRWRQQIHAMWDGVDIYKRSTYNYPNPPIMALILTPMAYMPKVHAGNSEIDLGAMTWYMLKVGMTAVTFLLVVRLIPSPDQPFPPAAQFMMMILSLPPMIGDLLHGNVNLWILFLIVASLYSYRQGRDAWSGLLMALAIACKVTPALFIPYFAIKREWKTVAWCLVGLVLFLILVPGAALGMERNVDLLLSWFDNMVRPVIANGEITAEYANQSLPGMLYRIFTHSPSIVDYNYQPIDYDNQFDFDRKVVQWVIKGFGISFLGLMYWLCRQRTPTRTDWRLVAEYGVVVLGMLLFSERTWKHHYVTLLLPFGALCYYLAAVCPTKSRAAYVIGTIVAAELLMAATSIDLWKPILPSGARFTQVYGAYLWANLLLLAALVFVRRQPLPPAETSQAWSAAAISSRTASSDSTSDRAANALRAGSV